MNAAERLAQQLQDIGLTEYQVDSVLTAVRDYIQSLDDDLVDAQQGSREGNARR